jgi:pyruvate,orthophosphate dikinase
MLLSWILIPAYEKILIAKSDLNKWPNSKGSLTSLAEAVKDLQNHNVYQHYIKSLEFLGNNLIDEISGILDASKNFPVTIRLIDPPLAEFLSESIIDQLQSEEIIQHEQKDLLINLFAHKDSMIGLRGVRLCNLSPEFTKTQIKSIFIAKMKDSESTSTEINILIPFVADAVEIDIIREMVNEIAQDLQFNGKWQLGTMIETPRAAILAKDMAQKSDFLSFGTNDLTQFTWAASRDYAQSDFLNHAIYSSRLEQDPFTLLDQQGVGKLIELAINEARAISPNIPIGICGEHAGEPQNIEYLGQLGVNYVSCSPISIATIRLACGQFGIRSNAINQSKNQNVH